MIRRISTEILVKVIIGLVVVGFLGMPAYGGQQTPTSAKDLWNRQHLYFQSISSLEFRSTMEFVFSEELKQKRKSPVEKLEITMHFTSDGQMYRSEVSFVDFATGKRGKTITACNGELYQILQVANAQVLSVSKSIENMPILKHNPYMGMNQMLLPFAFGFHTGCSGGGSTADDAPASLSLDTLRKSATWSHLVKDTAEIRQTNMYGHDCLVVKLKKIKGVIRPGVYEIYFAADLGYFPIYYKQVDLQGMVILEVRVLNTAKHGTENIVIPLRIETKEYSDDGKLMQSSIAQIDSKTLKVNQGINTEVFTISASENDINSGVVRYVDIDAQKNSAIQSKQK